MVVRVPAAEQEGAQAVPAARRPSFLVARPKGLDAAILPNRIVPGHGPASAPKAEVTAIREYLEDLSRAVSAAKEKTGNQFAFDQITELVKADLRPKYGQWGEFDNWMMMNVDRILLEQRLGY